GGQVLDLEQSAAVGAPRVGIQLGQLVAAGVADLPALRPVGSKFHPVPPRSSTRRAPTRSTGATRAAARCPAAPYAATMASATRAPTSGPRVSAKAVGPLPEIELPSAPFPSAAALASANPAIMLP